MEALLPNCSPDVSGLVMMKQALVVYCVNKSVDRGADSGHQALTSTKALTREVGPTLNFGGSIP
jgi:hypothetical protein